MIRINDLHVSMGGLTALASVSACLAKGRMTAIVGPNGAGKSSLMKTIAGLLEPTSGTINIEGRDLTEIDARHRARTIGYLAQDARPAWAMSVRELVALGRLPYRSPYAAENAQDQLRIDAAMAQADIEHLADRLVTRLSGGELARCLVARVLAGGANWILADEPFASLDIPHQFALAGLFRNIAAAGRGVACVVHQLDLTLLADDVILLAGGRLIAAGPREAVLTPRHLEAAFGMPFVDYKLGDEMIIRPVSGLPPQ